MAFGGTHKDALAKAIRATLADLATAQAVISENDAAALKRRGNPFGPSRAEVIGRNGILVKAVRWFVAQFQGDSGTGGSHWSQFAEYRLAVRALELYDLERRLGAEPNA